MEESEQSVEEVTVDTLEEFPEFEKLRQEVATLKDELKKLRDQQTSRSNRFERRLDDFSYKLKQISDDEGNISIPISVLVEAISSRMVSEMFNSRVTKVVRPSKTLKTKTD